MKADKGRTNTTNLTQLGILGAGAFGTSLAFPLMESNQLTLMTCFNEHVDAIKATMRNEFLPEVEIPSQIQISLPNDLKRFDILLWAFPIKPTPEILNNLKEELNGKPIIICSKGLMPDSNFICDYFAKELPDSKIGYLAGPNFAIEIAQEKITAADIVAEDIRDAEEFAEILTTENLKLNPKDDLIGAQLCGAMKNIIAIASGIVLGLDLGQNAHAVLITSALEEMKNFGLHLGAKTETFYGLCGLGDLILTTSSTTSRNTSLGFDVAKGKSIEESLKHSTCEGYETLPQIIELAKKNNAKLPICETVYKILFEGQSPDSIVNVFK